jgi:hypothetical protein
VGHFDGGLVLCEVNLIVRDAKNLARQWVNEQASAIPAIRGAFFHDSVNWLPNDAVLSSASDVDVMLVLAEPDPPVNLGKFLYRYVILEVSFLASDQVQSPDMILSRYDLAGSFQAPSIILDPTGELTELQAAVARDYAKRCWVYRRCEDARARVLRNLKSLNDSEPFHDQLTAWLFATGVTSHILLVAGLKNPTVRTRYVAVQELLADYGRSDFYEPLLELLGCARMSKTRVEHHLAALANAFDAAKEVIETPFFFASDISDIARPIAIDGTRELIGRGHHREAVFWLVATYSRCQKVLYHDAPAETRDRFEPGYRDLLADLGITSFADLRQRGEQVREFLPQIWAVAEAIIAANPEIED